ncbi:UNVERIFIED_CONTAM: hypothetical protein KB579_03650 [Streptococcus canis]|uniref:hypothetical protein n=1 Tax=Streptococcus canis TaxID=1329 RepID=UPI0024DE0A80|nr:hypothetical protein [Streptococcus canis]
MLLNQTSSSCIVNGIKKILEQFEKEDGALLSLDYLLFDNQTQNRLDLIYSFSASNSTIWSLVERSNRCIVNVLENDFSSFIEAHSNGLEDKKRMPKVSKS